MVELENISLDYNEKNILKEISISIKDGECILFTGKSGSGKSSIINSINGLAFEYENAKISGNIKINKNEIKDLPLYKISMMISSVFQNPKTHFFNVNTTLELLFYLENIGLNREQMEERMEDMLNIFKIKHLLNRNIFELSGGEKQILSIAACYISGCKTIVLDEPSSNLDEKYINTLLKMLKLLKKSGITLIIAEHRIYYLMDIVDRILLVKNGKIEREFTKKTFLEISEEKLFSMGLRNIYKPRLNVNETSNGKDLEIKNISCYFNNNGKLEIKDLSFSFNKIYGIIGKNGSGKSTFLKALTGLEDNKRNEILIQGINFPKNKRIKESSLVMQDVNHQLFSDTIENELKLGVKNLSQEKINEVLTDLNLLELKDRHPMSLSGGQKQRVAIASVFCKNSKLIFFDEPTSGMDYNNMLKISKLIKKMKTKDNILFIVSHDIEFLNETVDEVVNLENYRTY